MLSAKKIGAQFELKVRKRLEVLGYVVCKWHNQVDLDKGKMIPAVNFFRRGTALGLGSGFPDFLAYKPEEKVLLGVEARMRRTLKPEEKEKIEFYLKNKIFDEFYVAYAKDELDDTVLFHEITQIQPVPPNR